MSAITEVTSASTPPPPSFDGNHLSWQDFRTDVLATHRIRLVGTSPLDRIPQVVLNKIMTGQEDLARFDAQRQAFRTQVLQGTAFSPCPVFPPNCLPAASTNTFLQRCMTPRFGREALPQRSPTAQSAVYELPTPRPILACGFKSDALTEAESCVALTCLTNTGTVVDFRSGVVMPGTTLYCPFLVFERVKGLKVDDGLEAASNQCAVGASSCLRALQLLFSRAHEGNEPRESPVTFSCAIDNAVAVINYHWIEPGQGYSMAPLCKFDLNDDQHFNKFQVWIEAIEGWAYSHLLPRIKAALFRLTLSDGNTPPPSPMPSLTLSVDTKPCTEDGLMKSLRSAYPNVKWRYNGIMETPINSSVAQCGTPFQTMRVRTMNLSPVTPGPGYQSIRSPTDMKDVLPAHLPPRSAWSKSSPIGRHFPLSPLRSSYSAMESPCRSGSLSPHDPPPDAPSSPTNPILVLQKRLELAMTEIQDLKDQLHSLNSEVRVMSEGSSKDSEMEAFRASDELERRVSAIEVKITQSATASATASANASRDHSPHALNVDVPRRQPKTFPSLNVDFLFTTALLVVSALAGVLLHLPLRLFFANLLLLAPAYLGMSDHQFWWRSFKESSLEAILTWKRKEGELLVSSPRSLNYRWRDIFRSCSSTELTNTYDGDCDTPVAITHGGG